MFEVVYIQRVRGAIEAYIVMIVHDCYNERESDEI